MNLRLFKQEVSYLFLVLSTTGCLTISKEDLERSNNKSKEKFTFAKVDFALEEISFNETKVIYKPEQSAYAKQELIEVLYEFGIRESNDAKIHIEAKLQLKDTGCETVFVDSNCWVMLVAQPLSLYLLPTSYRMKYQAEVKMSAPNINVSDIKSADTVTYVHLALLPVAPYEIWSVKNAEFRKSLYRKILKDLETNKSWKSLATTETVHTVLSPVMHL